jgi:hypothetical protein
VGLVAACVAFFAAVAPSPAAVPAVRVKVTPAGQEPAKAAHQPILALPESGPVSVTLTAEVFGFTPKEITWTAVEPAEVKAQHIRAAKVPAVLQATTGPEIKADFPERGIYQINITATDGNATATGQAWVNVWDRLDGLNPLGRIGTNPGLKPPTSVRQLWPDPGPYSHPRLLFTDADWPELSAKANNSMEVTLAIERLSQELEKNFEKPEGPLRVYADALAAWADGGFSDAFYRESVEPVRVFCKKIVIR